ncbi:hypothetical protein ACHAW5_001969 [Stephanodiscus triporus]|uniref:2-(3-amino-3-carboxypropyl)histidine synthase subunit 1 n=1 Tax=Stephanodiscus triporus TaxID=2934178 RepID=A0ABD3QS84_9STRA
MYASTIGDILVRFSHRYRPRPGGEGEGERDDAIVAVVPRRLNSLSVLGDVTYGACCVDDLSAKSLGCDLLVHYGHSCLVPLNRTSLPCLYVFVEICVDVGHLVDCVRLTFEGEEAERRGGGRGRRGDADLDYGTTLGEVDPPSLVVEACVMGTVQFRSAVMEAARLLDDRDDDDDDDVDDSPAGDGRRRRCAVVRFRSIVPQAKPLSPGEVLGCTSPSGLAGLDFDAASSSSSGRRRRRRRRRAGAAKTRTGEDRRGDDDVTGAPSSGDDGRRAEPVPSNYDNDDDDADDMRVVPEERGRRERVMIFIADGRFHLEAAMMSNPTLRALRYDPYSKTLTEERYETSKMRGLRAEAVIGARRALGISYPLDGDDPRRRAETAVVGAGPPECGDDVADRVLWRCPLPTSLNSPERRLIAHPANVGTMGIVLGTLGRQGNPAILSRVRSLLRSRGMRVTIVLLSEIHPAKLDAMSLGPDGIRAWVQIACPRLSVDWGHHFSVPVLSPYELFVALGEADDSYLLGSGGAGEAREGGKGEEVGYPMDFYSKSGGPWANYHDENKDRKVVSFGS